MPASPSPPSPTHCANPRCGFHYVLRHALARAAFRINYHSAEPVRLILGGTVHARYVPLDRFGDRVGLTRTGRDKPKPTNPTVVVFKERPFGFPVRDV